MNLRNLTDADLMLETNRLVRAERELLTTVLHHLRELERRRLFGGHSSLFAYATKVLGYPEDQANRRISAMRLMREVPEIEKQIQNGELNLTHLGLAQSLFANEKRNGVPVEPARKLEIFAAMVGRTTREAERAVREFATTPARARESIRALGGGRNQVCLELSDEVLAQIEHLRGLLAHQVPECSMADVIARVCALGLERLSPARVPKKKVKPETRAAIRRRIWARDEGACVKCGSTFAVQEDHVVPKALGGAYTLENMRLLCRSCNQRAAIEVFGQNKMDPFLSPAAPRVH